MSPLLAFSDLFSDIVQAIVEVALVGVIALVAVVVVLGGAALLLESSKGKIRDDGPSLVPALLAFIGAGTVPVAERALNTESAIYAWVLTVLIAAVTFVGATIARVDKQGVSRVPRWCGYVVMAAPLLILLIVGVVSFDSLQDEWDDLSGVERGLLGFGCSIYAVGIVVGVVMIRAENRASRSATGRTSFPT